jgi:hypothetical protein
MGGFDTNALVEGKRRGAVRPLICQEIGRMLDKHRKSKVSDEYTKVFNTPRRADAR